MGFLSLKAAPGSRAGQAVSPLAPSADPADSLCSARSHVPGAAPTGAGAAFLGWHSSLRQPWLLARCGGTLSN